MQHDLLFSVGGDLFTLSLPSDVEPMPEGPAPDPPGPGPVGDRQELSRPGGDRGRSQGHAARPRRGAAPAPHARGEARTREARTARAGRRDGQAPPRDLRETAAAEAGRTPISPLSLVAAVVDAMPEDAIVVDESISSGHGVRELLRSSDPRSFYGLRGGGIGWGLPAALGVKLAQPGRPVVALVGDGSAMYTNQALWTAAHDSIPVVYVIFNNASYRILKQRTLALKGFSAEDDRTSPWTSSTGHSTTWAWQVAGRARELGGEDRRRRAGRSRAARLGRPVPARRAHRRQPLGAERPDASLDELASPLQDRPRIVSPKIRAVLRLRSARFSGCCHGGIAGPAALDGLSRSWRRAGASPDARTSKRQIRRPPRPAREYA